MAQPFDPWRYCEQIKQARGVRAEACAEQAAKAGNIARLYPLDDEGIDWAHQEMISALHQGFCFTDRAQDLAWVGPTLAGYVMRQRATEGGCMKGKREVAILGELKVIDGHKPGPKKIRMKRLRRRIDQTPDGVA